MKELTFVVFPCLHVGDYHDSEVVEWSTSLYAVLTSETINICGVQCLYVGDYHDSEVVVWCTSSYTVLTGERVNICGVQCLYVGDYHAVRLWGGLPTCTPP